MPRVRIGKFSFELPRNRAVRISLGVALVVLGGVGGWLPILGCLDGAFGLLFWLPTVPRFGGGTARRRSRFGEKAANKRIPHAPVPHLDNVA